MAIFWPTRFNRTFLSFYMGVALGVVLISKTALAGPLWNKLHNDFNMVAHEHAYCFTGENGTLLGMNINRKVRLASVSKAITTYWAVSELTSGAKTRYETTFYLKDKSLHIVGSLDPIMNKRKLFYLLSELNNLGITELKKITFDKNFRAYAGAEQYLGHIMTSIPDQKIAKTIYDYWHTPLWNILIKSYENFVTQTPNSILDALKIRKNVTDLNMKIGEVEAAATAPFDLNDKDVKVFTHRSAEISYYLKEMNIVSNNFIADQIFDKLGGEKAFDKFAQEFLNKHFPNYKKVRTDFENENDMSLMLYSGSGLPVVKDGKRHDNYATCAIVVKVIQELKKLVEEDDLALFNVMAVVGIDKGTFKNRLRSERVSNGVAAKTGTLFHTSALAGMINANSNTSFFGIFHNTQNGQANARIIQNRIVESLVDTYGGKKTFDYTPKFFFPTDETITVVQNGMTTQDVVSVTTEDIAENTLEDTTENIDEITEETREETRDETSEETNEAII